MLSTRAGSLLAGPVMVDTQVRQLHGTSERVSTMARVTQRELIGIFRMFVNAAEACGVDVTRWELAIGSKINGNAYGVYALVLPGHGHAQVHGFEHIGMTAGDAADYLRAGTRAFWLVLDARRASERDGA